jgi:hypothetical protein
MVPILSGMVPILSGMVPILSGMVPILSGNEIGANIERYQILILLGLTFIVLTEVAYSDGTGLSFVNFVMIGNSLVLTPSSPRVFFSFTMNSSFSVDCITVLVMRLTPIALSGHDTLSFVGLVGLGSGNTHTLWR